MSSNLNLPEDRLNTLSRAEDVGTGNVELDAVARHRDAELIADEVEARAEELASIGGGVVDAPRSLWLDAWSDLRRRPLFWVSLILIVVFVTMALFPQLFTNRDPLYCNLKESRTPPGPGHLFGTDLLGCDVYSRTIYGARASISVGVLATLATTMLGMTVGTFAGYFGGWVDSLLSRLGEIFSAIPLLLGGIVILYTFPSQIDTPFFVQVGKVVLTLMVLGWPSVARLMRSSVLQVKPNEYVLAARALGAGPMRTIHSHVMPNAIAPVIAVATINLGAYITTEASLSFLGIGLRPPIISWGGAISEASGLGYIMAAPYMLLFPAIFLSLTVLGFMTLGECVREAIDPKSH